VNIDFSVEKGIKIANWFQSFFVLMVTLSVAEPTEFVSDITSYKTLYFGVLHPVARILSRILEKPSFATIFY
jgi:hypothetical protein